MRRKKFPEDYKLRKKLIKYLIENGCSMFYIKLRLGYAFSDLERQRINSPYSLLSQHERLILNSDEFRKEIVDSLVEKMLEDEKEMIIC